MKVVSPEVLQEVTRRLVAALDPQKILLFGSHVWGSPDDDSDIDIMVITSRSERPGYRVAREAYRSLRGLKVPVEVVVRTAEEIEQGKNVKASLVHKVMQDGVVLYG